ncbi:MAG: hypothetical protein H6717_34160 [Polyangiaceae bacterium]|nr:hypothetical protein [Polyangiaceae bacterium]
MKLRGALVLSALLIAGCPQKKEAGGEGGEPQASPNASILPAPIASTVGPKRKLDAGRGGIPADSAGRLILPDAGPPAPTVLLESEPLPRDTLAAKDGTGVTLEARFKWFDVPSPPSGGEVATAAINKAKQAMEPRVTVDLAPAGRMRFTFGTPVFPVPENAELRSATEHWGHVLVWPDGFSYRVMLPGTLRALFAERRADVLPMAQGNNKAQGKGALLGLETEKVRIKSETGVLTLESGNISGIAESGKLLCRLLLELIAVDPNNAACNGSVPLKAEYKWPGGGHLGFEVTAIVRKPELPYGLLVVPPSSGLLKPGELPPQPAGVLLTQGQLGAFREKAAPGKEAPAADAPGEGLIAVNRKDTLEYLLIDGAPAAWVRPRAEQYLIGPIPGRYTISWRDFLGERVEPPTQIQLPARVQIGGDVDAGAEK